MNIETVNINSLRPARWATTHLLRPDERLLIQSMSDWGWLQPLVVRAEDRTIIDGNLRWVIAKEERPVSAKVGEDVPVVWVSCDEVDAMVLHVRLNRARGMQVATKLSSLLKWVAASGKYDARAIKNMLVMTGEEYEVLADGQYLKRKSIKEHSYSRGWVPVEAPKPGVAIAGEMRFERPANRDN
jgi:hypothetical protein